MHYPPRKEGDIPLSPFRSGAASTVAADIFILSYHNSGDRARGWQSRLGQIARRVFHPDTVPDSLECLPPETLIRFARFCRSLGGRRGRRDAAFPGVGVPRGFVDTRR